MNYRNWLDERDGACYIHVHVQPRASKNEISGVHGGTLKVRLTSPPVEGAANALLVKFMAEMSGTARSDVTIVAGKKSRQKTLRIEGVSRDKLSGLISICGGLGGKEKPH